MKKRYFLSESVSIEFFQSSFLLAATCSTSASFFFCCKFLLSKRVYLIHVECFWFVYGHIARAISFRSCKRRVLISKRVFKKNYTSFYLCSPSGIRGGHCVHLFLSRTSFLCALRRGRRVATKAYDNKSVLLFHLCFMRT